QFDHVGAFLFHDWHRTNVDEDVAGGEVAFFHQNFLEVRDGVICRHKTVIVIASDSPHQIQGIEQRAVIGEDEDVGFGAVLGQLERGVPRFGQANQGGGVGVPGQAHGVGNYGVIEEGFGVEVKHKIAVKDF